MEGVDNTEGEIQVLDESRLTTATYQWFNRLGNGKVGPSDCRVDCPEGALGQWFLYDEEGDSYSYCDPADEDAKKEFSWGDSIQLGSVEGATVTYAGGVTDDNLFRDGDLLEGFNYIGNPFPAAINIQDIQMEGVDNTEGEIQILDESRLTTATYQWFNRLGNGKVGPSDCRVDCPEGALGQWFLYDEEGDSYSYCDPADEDANKTIAAGEGFQLGAVEGASVTILAPFDL